MTSSIDVLPGESFSGVVRLASNDGSRNDSAIFRLLFSVENLQHGSEWFEWAQPYVTGGIDDYSSPHHTASGTISASTHADSVVPDDIDVYFENLTPTVSDTFSTGDLLRFTLIVPKELTGIGSFTIAYEHESFTDGASFVETVSGPQLTVNVVPAPISAALLSASMLVRCRRRTASA